MRMKKWAALCLALMLLLPVMGCERNEVPETTGMPTSSGGKVMNNDVGVTINNQGKITDEVVQTLKEHGISYVRIVIPYPYETDGVSVNAGYIMAKRVATQFHNAGIGVMAQSMWPGGMGYNAASGAVEWTSYYPNVFSDYDDEYFYKMVRSAATFIAADLKDICSTWLVSNEIDIATYTGPMTFAQIVRFVRETAEGLKQGNPAASCGVNMLVEVFQSKSLKFVRELYGQDSVLDWIGLDGYYGTLQEGGPETWEGYINTFYEAAQVPIVITEWSYSSAERDPVGTCKYQWEGHDARGPEVQAEYVSECMKVFARHPEIVATFWYALHNETGVCWECGNPECNLYSSWGLLNADNTAKPSLEAMKEAALLLQNR